MSNWTDDAASVTITIGESGICKATLVDAEEMIVGESPLAAGPGLVEFIRELWRLDFESGAVSVHPGRGETNIYFLRRELTS